VAAARARKRSRFSICCCTADEHSRSVHPKGGTST
jgi:hypothetical protein